MVVRQASTASGEKTAAGTNHGWLKILVLLLLILWLFGVLNTATGQAPATDGRSRSCRRWPRQLLMAVVVRFAEGSVAAPP